MKTYTSSAARKNFRDILDQVRIEGVAIGIGRYDKVEVLVIKYPENCNRELSDVNNLNANSASFDFLKNEPDLYSLDDAKELYV